MPLLFLSACIVLLKYRERRTNYGTVETKRLQLTYMNILNVSAQKKI